MNRKCILTLSLYKNLKFNAIIKQILSDSVKKRLFQFRIADTDSITLFIIDISMIQ